MGNEVFLGGSAPDVCLSLCLPSLSLWSDHAGAERFTCALSQVYFAFRVVMLVRVIASDLVTELSVRLGSVQSCPLPGDYTSLCRCNSAGLSVVSLLRGWEQGEEWAPALSQMQVTIR